MTVGWMSKKFVSMRCSLLAHFNPELNQACETGFRNVITPEQVFLRLNKQTNKQKMAKRMVILEIILNFTVQCSWRIAISWDDQNKEDKMEGLAMAQAVSRRPLTAKARVWSQRSAGGICGGQWHWDRFSHITSDLYANIRSPLLLTLLFIQFHRRWMIVLTENVF